MKIDETKRYTEDHEWIALSEAEDGVALVGISDYAQDHLGDIVLVELPEAGEVIAAKEAFGAIESPKSVSDLMAPLAGTIVEVNELLEDAPETVNEDPYGAGWIVKIRLEDPSGLEGLMDAAAYASFLSGLDEG